ncbi:glycosyltransferase family 4 protein [Scleromatobacter humisilvae]|uniref:Glycosyltransferase family 4 protein n=1 Tax=Scleromatobacter humisilvae TaxID=2897159 RepID=A0A9X1YJJ9_9BURK|nr:glycosyltransferase family 1 protein [Scleromatobacter humisilvae]MCK9686580.1 glycosyltransferase family 4 protein [Scleromatobacter humisilvae]
MTPNASPIVIDGVFFQIGRSGIARVWQSLLGLWAGTPFGDRLVVMDRARTAPRVAGIRFHDAPGLNYNDLEGDRRVVQDVCDEVGAALFMSTYYSYPKSTPSMAMVYDMIPEVMGYDLGTPMWRQKREALAYASSYTAISHSTARDLARFAGKAVDVRVDYTGSDFAPVSAEEVADFRRRHGIVRPYFMTSGSRADYKNAALFFSAFARFGDARKDYAIVCTGGGQLDPASQAAAGEASVHLAIFDDHDLRCAYAGALALVYPSRYEGFGLPVLEAMACECPAITSNASSLPEVGGDAVLYIELGANEEAQTFELLQQVQRPEVRASLIERGRVQARKFSWQTMADGVASALQAAADARPAPAPRVTAAAVAADDQLLTLGKLRCRLPATHPLPGLQREHPLFGRLPSALGAVLDDGDGVVIAGAGFGSTLAQLADARPALNLLGIERDAKRFAYLRTNAAVLRDGSVQLLHAELGSSALPGVDVALREIASRPGMDRVRLVVSTAGAGGPSLLEGAAGLCASARPMLYFSCQLGGDAQAADSWRQRLRALWACGYAGFWVFDNFGNPICEVSQPRVLDQLLDSLLRQNQRKASRTLYYYDVLAFGERDAAPAASAVDLHTR